MPVLKIGVFFDGTGNNANNYLLKKPLKGVQTEEKPNDTCGTDEQAVCFNAQLKENCVIPETYKRESTSASYSTPPSNIWYLYKHYKSGKTDQGYQKGIYVCGCGTEDGKEDDLVAMATGWSARPGWSSLWGLFGSRDTGVIAKTDEAIALIQKELKSSMPEIKELVFDSVEFELFGFSRGATEARHFANRVVATDKDLAKAFKKGGLDKKLYPEIKNKPTGSVNFIGLFDSVAAILALSDKSLDLSDSKTGSINIALNKDAAKHVFHLTAGHEVRYNFSLNRVLPAHTRELELPGAHSDIGGGYTDCNEERLFLSKPFYSQEDKDSKNEDSKAHADAKAMQETLLADTKWGPVLRLCKIDIITWSGPLAIGPKKLIGAAVIMRREKVCTGLEIIALGLMRDYSISRANCVFNKLGFDPEIRVPRLPADLVPIRDAIYKKLAYLNDRTKIHSAMDCISAELAHKYVHCSAFWSTVDANQEAGSGVSWTSVPRTYLYNVLLTNRPTDNFVRREFTTTGEELKR